MTLMVENLSAMQETWVQSLGQEDPLEEGMATHSSILVWRIPVDRGAWQAIAHGVSKSWTRLSELSTHIVICRGFLGSLAGKESTCNAGDPGSIPGLGSSPGEGIGYLLQYSWAAPVAQMVKNLPAMQETWV